MNSAIWIYPWDLADEGIPEVLDRIQAAGINGLNVAALYHAGKFLLPHNPRRKVYFPRSATLYIPDQSRFEGLRVQPNRWEESPPGFWEDLQTEARRRGLKLTAWMLGAHMSGLGERYPDLTVENPYGDRIPTDLCPANPDLRAFLVAAAHQVAGSGFFDTVLVEALEYMPFRHGYHHEVIGVPTSPAVEQLLSLCFCEHCTRQGQEAGVDVKAVRHWVRQSLDAHFANPYGRPLNASWSELKDSAGGALGSYLELRQRSVREAFEGVSGAIRSYGVGVAALDFGPLFGMGPDGRTWPNGVDLTWMLPEVDEIHPTFYFTDAAVLAHKLAEYDRVARREVSVIAAVRAILPQVTSRESLLVQVQAMAPHVDGFTFYNYGFMALETLGWIKDALAMAKEETR